MKARNHGLEINITDFPGTAKSLRRPRVSAAHSHELCSYSQRLGLFSQRRSHAGCIPGTTCSACSRTRALISLQLISRRTSMPKGLNTIFRLQGITPSNRPHQRCFFLEQNLCHAAVSRCSVQKGRVGSVCMLLFAVMRFISTGETDQNRWAR